MLEAKDPFHVNDKYPYKFKLEDSPGVTYPDKVVTQGHVKLEHKKAVMTVAFTPSDAGKKKITGVFHFSVCTERQVHDRKARPRARRRREVTESRTPRDSP